ncbi:DNA-binding response regulator, partial [Bacillus pumilus]
SHALNVDFVFVTGNSGYAVHSFDLNVHEYIMKPYQADRIAKSLDRYLSTKQEKSIHVRLLINHQSDIHVLQKQDVIFVDRTVWSTT